jgi:hypothetical protein
MTSKWLFCFVFALLLLMAGVMVLGAAQDERTPLYNLSNERVFQGVIESKGHIVEGFMYFPVRTRQGMIEVQAGPGEFLRLKNFDLVPGDNVRILGEKVVIGDRQIVLPREIRCARGVLIVRDDDGVPIWESKPTQMDPERPPISDDVCDATRSFWRIK